MSHTALFLHKQADRRIKKGHLWIYSNEIDIAKSPLKNIAPGELTEVFSANGQFLASALINPNALICGRVLSREPGLQLNEEFFIQRLRKALALRELCFREPWYRLVYGDADFLPGLVVDRYGDYFIVQITTAGMERVQTQLIAALTTLFQPRGILFRNNHRGRELENLEEQIQIEGELPELLRVQENDTLFEFAPLTGQKTGWFYDHRPNRALVQKIAKGKRVLDIFSYIGGWGIQAVNAGATEVVCVDASQAAIDLVTHNANLNAAADKIKGVQGKAIDVMKDLAEAKEKFDIVILDPPAFIQKRKDQQAGEAAYRHINELALKLMHSEGVLVSASCSMLLTDETLTEIVQGAARKHERQLQVFYVGSQGMDHPVHPMIPETRYIKAQFFRVSAAS